MLATTSCNLLWNLRILVYKSQVIMAVLDGRAARWPCITTIAVVKFGLYKLTMSSLAHLLADTSKSLLVVYAISITLYAYLVTQMHMFSCDDSGVPPCFKHHGLVFHIPCVRVVSTSLLVHAVRSCTP